MTAPPEEDRIRRREALVRLLRLAGVTAFAGGAGVWLTSRSRHPEETLPPILKRSFNVPADPSLPEMVVAQGDDPRALVRRALDELGGIRRFIARGDVVVVKPNIGWDRTPEQAANTNPEIVAEVVRLCHSAGAARVVVTDVSCNEPRRCFERSGIAPAASAEGALLILPEETKFREVDLHGDVLRAWPVFEPFLAADKIINIPIAKHHSLTGATLGMKNWYGILGGQRQRLHQHIHESLVDLAEFMRPTLTILDAYRVLLRNGPTGGNLEDVAFKKTLLASTDPVAVDAYAAKAYWDLDYQKLRYLKLAADRGLGTMNFETVRTRVAIL
ncbi:MAG TPA: DUF362 domain-containing protein [Methylomirabilota bacterium]|nr:DUF362 domain-containing protein [Methylomirabilota bacterium]